MPRCQEIGRAGTCPWGGHYVLVLFSKLVEPREISALLTHQRDILLS